jgi:hypothetical protein
MGYSSAETSTQLAASRKALQCGAQDANGTASELHVELVHRIPDPFSRSRSSSRRQVGCYSASGSSSVTSR